MHPRAFHFGEQLHFGFDVWDGKRFVRRDKASHDQWPCAPWEDKVVCRDDRFISKFTSTRKRREARFISAAW